MAEDKLRNPLLPWYIGIAMIAIFEALIIWREWSCVSELRGLEIFPVLIALPIIYLGLMWLTFRSQK